MSTTAATARRSSEAVGGARWLGVVVATRAKETSAGTDGKVYGRPRWL